MSVPTPFELSKRINGGFRAICSIYQGDDADNIKNLLSQNRESMAYYTMTKRDQNIANATKRPLFSEPNHTHYEKQHNWLKSLQGKMKWWMADTTAEEMDLYTQDMPDLKAALCAGGGGTYSTEMKYSANAADRGTFLHEAYGELIIKNSVSMFPGYEDFTHVLPDRVYSNNMAMLGCTPDGYTVPNADRFEEYLEMAWKHDPSVAVTRELHDAARAGAPHFIHEIKTMQKTGGGSTGNGAMISRSEITGLYDDYLRLGASEEMKRKAVSFVAQRYVDGNWMDNGDLVRCGLKQMVTKCTDTNKNRENMAKMSSPYKGPKVIESTNERNRPGLFKTSYNVALSDSVDYSEIESVSGDVVKHLCDHKVIDLMDKNRVLRVAEYYPAKRVLDTVGKCKIIFYKHSAENNRCEQLFHLEFDKSPFTLVVNGGHFRQSTNQMASSLFLNSNAKHIFTTVMSYQGKAVKMAVQISWDQGLNNKMIDDYTVHLFKRIAEVDQDWCECLTRYGRRGICARPNISLGLDDTLFTTDASGNNIVPDDEVGFASDSDEASSPAPAKKRRLLTHEQSDSEEGGQY